ncbi:hypothetical protein B2G50_01470 [Leptospira interrogans serovar Canicola]|nr:hypothetical protein B2G50_01470 [Leptospira interrogans serovar Canicola]
MLSFPYFWVGDGGGKVRKNFLYQKNIHFASKKTHSCRNTCKMCLLILKSSSTSGLVMVESVLLS